MEFITDVLGQRTDGTKIVRNYFLYPTKVNILKNAQKEFTKDEKKIAKILYQNSLKNNPTHNSDRVKLVEQLVKSEFPKWNIKLNFL